MTDATPILVAEDEESDVIFLRRAFKKAAVPNPLIHVANGNEAMRYFASDNGSPNPLPALILVDLKMPICDGFALLAWLRDQPQLQHIPVVVLTSSELEADRRHACQLGARDYLIKPLIPDELVPLVQTFQKRFLAPAA